MLVESLVTLSRDNRNNSAAFETSLKLCENLGMVLGNAESLLQKVQTPPRLPLSLFLS